MISKRDILEICCKVLGLVYLVWGIAFIPHAVSAVAMVVRHGLSGANEQFPWLLPGTIATSVVFIAGAFFLLKYSKGIASFLVREDGPVQFSVGEDWQESLYTLCCA